MRISPIRTGLVRPLQNALYVAVASAGILTACSDNKSGKTNTTAANIYPELQITNVAESTKTDKVILNNGIVINNTQQSGYQRTNIGNILFYTDDLNTDIPVKERKRIDGKTEYQVALKSGTVIKFNENQPKDASVIEGIHMGYEGKNSPEGTKFQNCNLSSIIGTPGRDYYYLSATTVGKIDLKSCDKDEVRLVKGSKCSNIISKDDFSKSELRDGDVHNLNEGWFARSDELDEAMHEF